MTVEFVPRSGASWRDPYPMYAALREAGPVHHHERGDYWVLPRYEEVFGAVRDTATFSSAEGLSFTYGEREKIGLDEVAPMVMLDPPDHTAFRRVVARGFTPRAVEEIEPAVRAFVVSRLQEAIDAGGEVDIMALLFKPLPSFVVAHYLGVPEADRVQFDGWTEAIVAANSAGDPFDAADAVMALMSYFSGLIEERRAAPGDDTVSELVRAAEGDPEVPVLQVLGFAFTMVAGGNDTVSGLLGGSAELLTAHPDQRQLLADDESLLPGAVEELLRLTAPVQGLARTTTSPVTIAGVEIPAGKKVALLYASANRDEAQFGPSAGALDVRRNPRQILAFGYGAHHCLGAAAARLQGRVVLEELLRLCPRFAVDAERGEFAPGSHVRRYLSLPFVADPSP